MTITTTDAPGLIRSDVGPLLIDPVIAAAVATNPAVSTVVRTNAGTFRIPTVTADPSAEWLHEGAEIPVSEGSLGEVEVTPSKVAGLSIITRELADDSSPEAAAIVGAGLARDIARKVDEAFNGNLAAPAPAGLASLADVDVTLMSVVGTTWDGVAPFIGAQYAAEGVGATVTAWIAHPADALALSTLTEGDGSRRMLLQPDPTQEGRRLISGVPLLVSPYAVEGTVHGVDASRVYTIIREDAEVETDRSVYFTSDRVAVRAIARLGFGFPQPQAVVRIKLGAA